MRRIRRLILGVNLQDRRAGDEVLVGEIGGGFGEHDVDLADRRGGDGVDLIIFATGCDAYFYGELCEEGRRC